MVVETLDLSDVSIAVQVLGVQRAAYQVEADLIGSSEIPPLQEDLHELVAAPVHWYGIRRNGEVVAAMAFTRKGREVDIDRLVVAPAWMRCGFGSALLGSLDATATVTVSTGASNIPACEFYLSHGFEPAGESEPIPGLLVTHFLRSPG